MFKLSFGLVLSLKLSFLIVHALPLGPEQYIPHAQPPVIAHPPQPNHIPVPFPLYLPHAVRIPIPKAVTVERDGNIHSASRVPVTFHDPRLLDITYLSHQQSYLLGEYLIEYATNVFLYTMKLGLISYEDREKLKNALLDEVQKPARSILLRAKPEPRQLLLCFVYIARTEHSLRRTPQPRNPYDLQTNVSDLTRIFRAALAMAIKYTDEHERKWPIYAGMTPEAVHQMEYEFLELIHHDLRVDDQDLLRFHKPICLQLLQKLGRSVPHSCLEYESMTPLQTSG